MGKLFYDGDAVLDVPDRTLAHVQYAILSKLRRQEQFMLTWNDKTDDDTGYNSIWVSPSIPLRFKFDSVKRSPLNRDWVESMVANASNTGNLLITQEADGATTNTA